MTTTLDPTPCAPPIPLLQDLLGVAPTAGWVLLGLTLLGTVVAVAIARRHSPTIPTTVWIVAAAGVGIAAVLILAGSTTC